MNDILFIHKIMKIQHVIHPLYIHMLTNNNRINRFFKPLHYQLNYSIFCFLLTLIRNRLLKKTSCAPIKDKFKLTN